MVVRSDSGRAVLAAGQTLLSHTSNKVIFQLDARKGHKNGAVLVGQYCAQERHDRGECLRMNLVEPKGIAVSYREDLYFIDDRDLWRFPMSRAPLLNHTAGDSRCKNEQLMNERYAQASETQRLVTSAEKAGFRMRCGVTYKVSDFAFQMPTKLLYNPLEDSLYIVDQSLVYKLHLKSLTLATVIGCHDPLPPGSHIRDITFNPDGELIFATATQIFIRSSLDHSVSLIAGSNGEPSSFQPHLDLAHSYSFHGITAITSNVHGELFVADSTAHRAMVSVLSVFLDLAEPCLLSIIRFRAPYFVPGIIYGLLNIISKKSKINE
ncbi:hypothetical protein Ciccas_013756 [Cichlidogyrus casuarinus]|uniref:Uncharacterized protein n=1 Tax=Cichlidogyrus casuarinus TaxID=1844966 RepID=A0ABD2PJV2_9PLAT